MCESHRPTHAAVGASISRPTSALPATPRTSIAPAASNTSSGMRNRVANVLRGVANFIGGK